MTWTTKNEQCNKNYHCHGDSEGEKKKEGLEKEDIKRRRGTVLVSSTQLGLLFIV